MKSGKRKRLEGKNKAKVLVLATSLYAQGWTYIEIQAEARRKRLPVPSLGFLSKNIGKGRNVTRDDGESVTPTNDHQCENRE